MGVGVLAKLNLKTDSADSVHRSSLADPWFRFWDALFSS
jgi:hypothetical protein